jgi:hypothetical protein
VVPPGKAAHLISMMTWSGFIILKSDEESRSAHTFDDVATSRDDLIVSVTWSSSCRRTVPA